MDRIVFQFKLPTTQEIVFSENFFLSMLCGNPESSNVDATESINPCSKTGKLAIVWETWFKAFVRTYCWRRQKYKKGDHEYYLSLFDESKHILKIALV